MLKDKSLLQEEKIDSFLNNLKKSKFNYNENKAHNQISAEPRNRNIDNKNKRKPVEKYPIETNNDQHKLNTYLT